MRSRDRCPIWRLKVASAIFAVQFILAGNVGAIPLPGEGPDKGYTASPVEIHNVDHSPIALTVNAAPESKAPGNKEQSREAIHELNEQSLTDYTRLLAIATIGLIVVAVAQVLLFFWQLKYMRIGLDDAKTSADAARDSAFAASQSVTISKLAMIAGNRAFVHYNGCRWISHQLNDDDKQIFWRIGVQWINAGNTPTRNLRFFVHHEFLDTPMDQSFQFVAAKPEHITTIAPKGQVSSTVIDLFGVDLAAVKNGEKQLYIWGVAWYSDVFPESPEHITKFCVHARNLTGNPVIPWDDELNRFDIQFAHIERHNCVDDDCC